MGLLSGILSNGPLSGAAQRKGADAPKTEDEDVFSSLFQGGPELLKAVGSKLQGQTTFGGKFGEGITGAGQGLETAGDLIGGLQNLKHEIPGAILRAPIQAVKGIADLGSLSGAGGYIPPGGGQNLAQQGVTAAAKGVQAAGNFLSPAASAVSGAGQAASTATQAGIRQLLSYFFPALKGVGG